jgi:putative membrane protein
MNRRRLILASALALPAMPALAQSSSGLLNLFAGTGAGANAFVERVTIASNFEVDSSRTLLEKSTHPQIRDYATRMVNDHTAMLAELRAMPDAATRQPAALDNRMQEKLIRLRTYEGDELNRWYVQMQVDGHKETVEIFEAYASNGEVPLLKQFAERHLPMMRAHLAAAEALQAPRPQ